MANEIERKFLMKDDTWVFVVNYKRGTITQGYLKNEKELTIRVRLIAETKEAFITLKGAKINLTCPEYEYKIPYSDGLELMELAEAKLEKTRWVVTRGDLKFEIDEYHGKLKGLVVAEVELESEDQEIVLPDWIGEEITHDPKYLNCNLAKEG